MNLTNNEITINEILDLYKRGTITVLNGGQINFRKEKAVRLHPNDFKVIKNKLKLSIPVFH